MKPPHIDVSDHAVCRYLERVRGIDLGFVRNEIRKTVAGAVAIGANSISVDGFTYCLKGCVVVTIVPGASPSQSRLKAAVHNGNGLRRLQRPEGRR